MFDKRVMCSVYSCGDQPKQTTHRKTGAGEPNQWEGLDVSWTLLPDVFHKLVSKWKSISKADSDVTLGQLHYEEL